MSAPPKRARSRRRRAPSSVEARGIGSALLVGAAAIAGVIEAVADVSEGKSPLDAVARAAKRGKKRIERVRQADLEE